jgi:Rrf2 family protein
MIVTIIVTFMAGNSRFYMAVHILAILAMYPDERHTSECIAESVGTHPVIVRRILGMLKRAGLVEARPGANGGSLLSIAAMDIPLSAVFKAVEEDPLLTPHARPNQGCPVGKSIHQALEGIASSVEQGIDSALAQATIAQTVEQIRKINKKK